MKFAPIVAAAAAGLATPASAFKPISDIFSNDPQAPKTTEHRIPSSYESAVMGRRILALSKLATFSTVFPEDSKIPGVGGKPVSLVDYYSDCEDEGNPTILEIKIGTSFQNARAGSNLTISVNWVPPYPPAKRLSVMSRLAAYVPFLSSSQYNVGAGEQPGTPDTVPYSAANLPRFALMGYLEDIEPNAVDAVKLAACFTAKHHDAKYWLPGNPIHESQWSRMVVEKIYWVGGFGDRALIGWIPLDEWKSVTRDEWQAIRLPGEKKGWSEWSVHEDNEL